MNCRQIESINAYENTQEVDATHSNVQNLALMLATKISRKLNSNMRGGKES